MDASLYVRNEGLQLLFYVFYQHYYWVICGLGSSVGIATDLRAGRSGIESRWKRDFPPFQTGPGTHPASCKMGTVSFPGVKCGRRVLLTTHSLLVPRLWKSRAIPLLTLWACNGITLPFFICTVMKEAVLFIKVTVRMEQTGQERNV